MCVLSHAEYGGLGLDFSYSVAVAEELGNIRCGGIPMAIGVQSDMATPALARYNPTNNDVGFVFIHMRFVIGERFAA